MTLKIEMSYHTRSLSDSKGRIKSAFLGILRQKDKNISEKSNYDMSLKNWKCYIETEVKNQSN